MELLGGTFSSYSSIPSAISNPPPTTQSVTPLSPPTEDTSRLLKRLNDDFLETLHLEAQNRSYQHAKYSLIYQGGILSLWQMNKGDKQLIERVNIPTQLYHDTKTLAHIPTLLYVNMQRGNRVKLYETLIKLRGLREKLTTDDTLGAYIPYVNHCLWAISEYLQNKDSSTSILSQLKSRTNHTVARLMKLATHEALSNLKASLGYWLEQHNIQLPQVKTVIACTHGPKSRLIELQYILSLYKQALRVKHDGKILDNYVYITEVLPSQLANPQILEEQLIDEFLIPSQLNQEIGEAMLDDPLGMFQDILCEYGEEWVNEQQPHIQCPYKRPKN